MIMKKKLFAYKATLKPTYMEKKNVKNDFRRPIVCTTKLPD